ncbi:hypothetical protein QOZ80_5AG0394980 [Eleusine coracana subsp. coracana]|nr:hypothetical protein QOZ80_5AG0394980 [Eleusine coracana subsp. coracana]
MCGIALVLSGDRLLVVPSAAGGASSETRTPGKGTGVSVDELKDVLRRRGPDSLGCERLQLCADGSILGREGCDGGGEDGGRVSDDVAAELIFIGATLHLRGAEPVVQPLVSTSRSVLVYNGEIYRGIHIAIDENDTRALFSSLESCCSCDCHGCDEDTACPCCGGVKSVLEILSTIKGPWALIYWQMDSNIMWFGRDAFWRRSLLVHWPTAGDPRFILSSVSPPSFARNHSPSSANGLVSDLDMPDYTMTSYWEELPCGIYSIYLKDLRKNVTDDCIVESLMKSRKAEEDTNNRVVKRDLPSDFSSYEANCLTQLAHRVLAALRESVMLRTNVNALLQGSLHRDEELAPIAVLFSGGLDSMILAALLDQCINSKWTIDLLNVSFDGQLAPDRISAIAGLRELQRISPLRRWRLVEIDTALTDLKYESEHVMSLIHPSNTYMDLNIGIALWLAAGGDGWVDGSACHLQDGSRYKYRSTSRVLIVGSGADEQCAGYGRHRTKYRVGGWNALDMEMRLDVQRIWKRNMGRDDRCISDHGKEARFPFLDENVIQTLLDIPLWEIAKLDEPVGKGDKKILREVARLLGLQEAALQPKRAIQFGSRIARESNRKNFGSNRAANQASAGSVQIHQHMH